MWELIIYTYNLIHLICILFLLYLPGKIIFVHLHKRINHNIIEDIVWSNFYGILFISILSPFLFIFKIYNRTILILFIVIIPFIILTTYLKQDFQNISLNIDNNIIILILVSLIGSYIYLYPSLKTIYPIGWDTYRLHIIRINFIINRGNIILHKSIIRDILNFKTYQWGFHFLLASIATILKLDGIEILNIIPSYFGFLFPISIYFSMTIFDIKKEIYKISSAILSLFTLADPTIHGIYYPFPSSLSIFFLIIFFKLLTINIKYNKIVKGIITLILIHIYKGNLMIIILTISSYIWKYIYDEYDFNKLLVMSGVIVTNLFIKFAYNFSIIFSSKKFNNISYLNIFNFKNNFYDARNLLGIYNYILIIIISIYYLTYIILKNKKDASSYLTIIFLSVFVQSTSFLLGYRWLLYYLPINIIIILHFISDISMKIKKEYLIIFICLLILTNAYQTATFLKKPKFNFGPDFSKSEEDVYQKITLLNDGDLIYTPYRITILFNSYAIDKHILYNNGSLIKYFEVPNFDYLSILNDEIVVNNSDIKDIYLIIPLMKNKLINKLNQSRILYTGEEYLIYKNK